MTALLFKGEVVGACIGFYSPAHDVYLTHMTATHRDLQGGTGIGRFLRRQQLRQLEQRRSPDLAPLEVVSLSANSTDGDNGGAVPSSGTCSPKSLAMKRCPARFLSFSAWQPRTRNWNSIALCDRTSRHCASGSRHRLQTRVCEVAWHCTAVCLATCPAWCAAMRAPSCT